MDCYLSTCCPSRMIPLAEDIVSDIFGAGIWVTTFAFAALVCGPPCHLLIELCGEEQAIDILCTPFLDPWSDIHQSSSHRFVPQHVAALDFDPDHNLLRTGVLTLSPSKQGLGWGGATKTKASYPPFSIIPPIISHALKLIHFVLCGILCFVYVCGINM